MPSIYTLRWPSLLLALCLCTEIVAAISPQQSFVRPGQTKTAPLISLDLAPYFNNRGINDGPPANFDGVGNSYPASQLPNGIVPFVGLEFTFPSPTHASSPKDNVVALGQTVGLPPARYSGLYLLTSASHGDVYGNITVTYADGTTSDTFVQSFDWRRGGRSAAIETDHSYRGDGGRENYAAYIYVVPVFVDPERVAIYFTLPRTRRVNRLHQSMHVWAASVQRAVVGHARVNIVAASSTTKQIEAGDGVLYQAIEVTVQNIGTKWVLPANAIIVRVETAGVVTHVPGIVERLAPGQQVVVQVGINAKKGKIGKIVATVTAENSVEFVSVNATIRAGIPKWQPNEASLSQHESPTWFNHAKFGIFIHWGVYSIPAWSPVGKEYAEWYWYQMSNPNDPTHNHHLGHYGRDHDYDHFIPKFTAERFDPNAWLDLFEEAGAKYFVIVTKHHDGFALFESKVTNRTSWAIGPKRNFIKEVFDAAKNYPELKRGLYYSLPEWYHPVYDWPENKHAFPGGHPKNPYTGETLEYTGHAPIKDYVNDLQLPQLLELVDYDPDIIWCDIGGPHNSTHWIAPYFNRASEQGRQVTVNNRCGLWSSDFDTPEYATFSSTSARKWEATHGIDPRSFGYNQATPDYLYSNSSDLIRELVDVVSKNGNLLLNIGPRADGTVPEVMARRLREMGAWLARGGEALFDTTYWWIRPEEGPLRFTVGSEAFYVVSLERPESKVVIKSPVPIRKNDHVWALWTDGADEQMRWEKVDGTVVIHVTEKARMAGEYAWAFKLNRSEVYETV